MRQLTPKQCLSLHESGLTNDWSDEQVARLQLFQSKILFPETRYLKAIQNTLRRPVFQDEIAFRHSELIAEYLALGNTEPTMDDIKALLPQDQWHLIGENLKPV